MFNVHTVTFVFNTINIPFVKYDISIQFYFIRNIIQSNVIQLNSILEFFNFFRIIDFPSNKKTNNSKT